MARCLQPGAEGPHFYGIAQGRSRPMQRHVLYGLWRQSSPVQAAGHQCLHRSNVNIWLLQHTLEALL